MIPDETADSLETLLFTVRTIVESSAEGKKCIAAAYRDARSLVATIDLDSGSARPRIVACLKQADTYKDAGDLAAAGWMLTAIQERVAEGDLYGWRKLKKIVDAAVHELILSEKASLH